MSVLQLLKCLLQCLDFVCCQKKAVLLKEIINEPYFWCLILYSNNHIQAVNVFFHSVVGYKTILFTVMEKAQSTSHKCIILIYIYTLLPNPSCNLAPPMTTSLALNQLLEKSNKTSINATATLQQEHIE